MEEASGSSDMVAEQEMRKGMEMRAMVAGARKGEGVEGASRGRRCRQWVQWEIG